MKIKNLLPGFLLASLGLVATRLLFAKLKSESSTSVQTSFDAIDAYVEEQRRHLSVPCVSLVIVEGDRRVHFRGFGSARPGGEAPNPSTPFFIGSVTKSFTALAIMQLVEEGKVELDAPVQHYLPWFRVADTDASVKMTVRHLLNHTSGLSMLQGQEVLSDVDDHSNALDRQLRALSTVRLINPPGTKFAYNNTNYNILGLIVEVTSAESYMDYIQHHIFDPLEMSHSYFSKEQARRNGLAMGHRFWFGYPVPEPNLPQPLGSLPSGQLISCAEDMAHYLIAQLNGGRYGSVQILSAGGMDEMHRGEALIHEMGMDLGYYGMGWESRMPGKSAIIWHSGIVPDYGAFAALLPEQKKGLAMMYNVNHAMVKLTFDEFGMGVAESLAGEPPTKTFLTHAPWLMRSMVLIPVLQVLGVILTLRQVHRWQAIPSSRPSSKRLWRQHVLLPLVPNLLIASSLIPMFSKMRGWVRLFMPDFSWMVRISGGFAVIWVFLRTGLVLNTLRKPRSKYSSGDESP